MTRTIKINNEAFERLDDARKGKESLSAVIKRCVPKRRSFEEIAEFFSKLPISEEFLVAVDESATRRRKVKRNRRP